MSQSIQRVKNEQNSQYFRGLAVGAAAAGTVLAGAYAINQYMRSGTPIIPQQPIPADPLPCVPQSQGIGSMMRNGAFFGGKWTLIVTVLAALFDKDFSSAIKQYHMLEIPLHLALSMGVFAVAGAAGNVLLQNVEYITNEAFSLINPFK